MEDIIKGNNNIINEIAPPTPTGNETDTKVINYDCTECSSLIEILSINEINNNIKFRCINAHNKEILIKEYLKYIEKNKDANRKGKCELHNKKYKFYCFDCNRHICDGCIKLIKEHKKCHRQEYILYSQPKEEDLEKMRDKIEEYRIRIEKIRQEKKKEIENIFNNNIMIEDNKLKYINNRNKEKEKDEIDENKEKYKKDIEEIKRRYEKEIKIRKSQYKIKNKNIKNKYKIINNREKILYEFKIKILNNNKEENLKNIINDNRIQNLINLKKLNQIIYNTYNGCNNNYFYAININNIINNNKNEIITKINQDEIKEELITKKDK